MAGRIALLSRWLCAAFMLLAAMGSAQAEKRVALVIGNSAYQHAVALPNPASDARLISDTLLSLGFFVVGGGAKIDLDKAGFDTALAEFDRELVGADVALIYYAGHGVETHGLNFLVPVDANPASDGDMLHQTVSVAGIMDKVERAGARINLVLLDACRDNPFRDQGMHAAHDGLEQMQAPPGTLISFATQPRSVSLDGDGGHSPYARALADTLPHPGYGLFKTFNEVGLAVQKATNGSQLPWVSLSPISGNFFFAGREKPASATASPTPAPPVQEASLTPADNNRALITDCDRLAATPWDTGHSPDLFGVMLEKIDVVAATRACDEAMQRYPDVARFVFEAGRVATARKDFAAARRYYDKAADAGYAMAMNNIGGIYEDGKQGQPTNYAEAAKWYGKAADAGEPVAMMNLGWLYEQGLGVKKDCAETVRLYQTAAKAGLSPAMSNLGLLYYRGECVQRDYAEARRRYEQALAAWSDNSGAMNDMGVLYNDGAGVPRNKTIARQWFLKAAALGNPEAKQNLK
jgi:tetratricopeptide (TPR) repeat protein